MTAHGDMDWNLCGDCQAQMGVTTNLRGLELCAVQSGKERRPVILLHRVGDNHEFTHFATLDDVIRCAPASPIPQFEVASDLLASTERTTIR
jgi:hypothetical protein